MDDAVAFTRIEPDTPERFVSLRRALGVASFGINQMSLRAGERGRIHRHTHQEEVYLVISGVLTLAVEGQEHDLGAGELARVGPQARRQVLNRGPGTCIVVALGGAGDHQGRDATAFAAWDDTTGGTPQEIPLPDDLPASELRS